MHDRSFTQTLGLFLPQENFCHPQLTNERTGTSLHIKMDRLPALAKELGYPSAKKLFSVAQRENIKVTFKQVQDFTSKQNVRQVFHALPPSKGKITSAGLNDAWVADLVDYSWQPNKSKESDEPPYQYILVVHDIFSRKLMARPIRDKLAQSCKDAFEDIVDDFGIKPQVLSTDQGWEFKGIFDDYLRATGIYHRLKDPRALNSQGTLDAAIRVLRPMLARIQVEDSTGDWAAEVARAVSAYNRMDHSHLHGRSPDEVPVDGALQFYLKKQAAEDLQHNSEVVAKRDARLVTTGHFREELPAQKFRRGFQVKYGDKVHVVESVLANHVVDKDGKEFSTRHVLPIPAGSSDTKVGATSKSVAPADEKKKTALEPFKQRISDFIGNVGKFEYEVVNYMKELNMDSLMVHGLSYRRAMLLLGFIVHGTARGSGKQLVTRPQAPAAPAPAAPERPVRDPVAATAALAAPVRRRIAGK